MLLRMMVENWWLYPAMHLGAVLFLLVYNFVDDILRYVRMVKIGAVHTNEHLQDHMQRGLRHFHKMTGGIFYVFPWVIFVYYVIITILNISKWLFTLTFNGKLMLMVSKMVLLMFGIRETKTEEEVKE